MTIEEIIEKRSISGILHFTTHLGLVGILDSKFVKSRQRLPKDKRLEFILKPNASMRKDIAWLDYVNLSVSRINTAFFDISSERWHPEVWWCILSFDPNILTHEGVYFTSTNNIYPSVIRGQGAKGLEEMFAQRVIARYGSIINRDPTTPDFYPTCIQAEILYPGELSTSYLQRIYVSTGEEQDEVYGQISALHHRDVPVSIDPRVFGHNLD